MSLSFVCAYVNVYMETFCGVLLTLLGHTSYKYMVFQCVDFSCKKHMIICFVHPIMNVRPLTNN